jgi:hypothetical protein
MGEQSCVVKRNFVVYAVLGLVMTETTQSSTSSSFTLASLMRGIWTK